MCLVYFAEQYRKEALMTLCYSKYSWAIASVNVVVLLMQTLDVLPNRKDLNKCRYWSLFEQAEGFYELFCHAFLHLHSLGQESQDEMHFNTILHQCAKHVHTCLLKRTVSKMSPMLLTTQISLAVKHVTVKQRRPWNQVELDLVSQIQTRTEKKVATRAERHGYASETNVPLFKKSVQNIQSATPPASPAANMHDTNRSTRFFPEQWTQTWLVKTTTRFPAK